MSEFGSTLNEVNNVSVVHVHHTVVGGAVSELSASVHYPMCHTSALVVSDVCYMQ